MALCHKLTTINTGSKNRGQGLTTLTRDQTVQRARERITLLQTILIGMNVIRYFRQNHSLCVRKVQTLTILSHSGTVVSDCCENDDDSGVSLNLPISAMTRVSLRSCATLRSMLPVCFRVITRHCRHWSTNIHHSPTSGYTHMRTTPGMIVSVERRRSKLADSNARTVVTDKSENGFRVWRQQSSFMRHFLQQRYIEYWRSRISDNVNDLTLQRAEMSTGYTWPSRSNLHF